MMIDDFIVLKFNYEPSTDSIIYRLWDTKNKCLLDEWEIKTIYSSNDMERDLRLIGFNHRYDIRGSAASIIGASL
jgi:hypothetical protein